MKKLVEVILSKGILLLWAACMYEQHAPFFSGLIVGITVVSFLNEIREPLRHFDKFVRLRLRSKI